MTKILLDTSIIVDYLRQKDKSLTILFNLISPKYELYASIITHTESYGGKSVWEHQKAQEALEKIFANITILPLDENLSKKAGEIRAKHNTAITDAVIAATVINHKLTLVTLNIKDFKDIEGIKLFRK